MSDLACLQKQIAADSQFGSGYQIGSAFEVVSATQHRIKLRFEQPLLILEAIVAQELETKFELKGRQLTIFPAEVSKSPVRATRWGYRLNKGE